MNTNIETPKAADRLSVSASDLNVDIRVSKTEPDKIRIATMQGFKQHYAFVSIQELAELIKSYPKIKVDE